MSLVAVQPEMLVSASATDVELRSKDPYWRREIHLRAGFQCSAVHLLAHCREIEPYFIAALSNSLRVKLWFSI